MSSWAFVFPGQGSQYVGMGKEFYDTYDICRETIDLADRCTDTDLKHILFEENEDINRTRYTQIAMLGIEIAIYKKLKSDGVSCSYSAGLSLGEYAALICSEAMDEEDAYRLVALRGRLMEEAYPKGGAMAAVMSDDAGTIESICTKICADGGLVSIANYNCPGQIVITGREDSVESAMEEIKKAGAKKCTRLKVSGPFHSALMEPASMKLYEAMKNVRTKNPAVPYISNVTADVVSDGGEIKELLKRQICSPVRWQQCVEKMIALGVDTFVEIGPKKSLSGFIKRINRNVRILKIENIREYEEVVSIWRQG